MRILYVAPEHVSGGFELFVKGHRRLGHEARWITFFRNKFGFAEDLCFDLRGMPTVSWVAALKRSAKLGDRAGLPRGDTPPFWRPRTPVEPLLFALRDLQNQPRIRRAISRHHLDDFDIYHFEQGADPFRDGRWVRELSARGKAIVCFYHGSDVRQRGVLRVVHRCSRLNLTSEIDLLPRIPGMRYLYLPIDAEALKPTPRPPDGRIRIGHAARNRKLKGSDAIEAVVGRLAERYPIDWVMIENLPHPAALEMTAACDVFIDQITDLGGWGYGASSVEALALGIPTITKINEEVAAFLGRHPFVSATADTLENALAGLIEDEPRRRALSVEGRRWVEERHGLDAVMGCLYGYYREAGLL